MKIDLYDKTGKKSKQITLNAAIFGLEPNVALMHKLLLLQRANARINLAKTLTKWEVRWWWKKPYRQKWTWRARQWSTRNPHYIWWWVAHWPRWVRNFTIQMPKKTRRIALFSYLSALASENNIIWLEWYDWWVKTKNMSDLINNIKLGDNMLIVLWEKNKDMVLSARNLPWVKVILAQYLNPVDLTTYKKICFVWDSLKKLDEIFLSN